ncbi:hypothetical protein [Sporichthya polymorpha]|nr:hypothetical protein [Sporichthya polymorpha]
MKQISARMSMNEIQLEMEIQSLRVRVAELEAAVRELLAVRVTAGS